MAGLFHIPKNRFGFSAFSRPMSRFRKLALLRRFPSRAPANLAEGFGNRHTNIYLECISRSKGEIRETRHHLKIAHRKKYLDEERLNEFLSEYESCSKMLYKLEGSLSENPKK
jgi:23S rRNA-intervening sequence protein